MTKERLAVEGLQLEPTEPKGDFAKGKKNALHSMTSAWQVVGFQRSDGEKRNAPIQATQLDGCATMAQQARSGCQI